VKTAIAFGEDRRYVEDAARRAAFAVFGARNPGFNDIAMKA